MGLSPMTIVGSPVFATAVDTSRRNDSGDNHKQHQAENMQQQQQQQRDRLQTPELQPNAELSMPEQQQQTQRHVQLDRRTQIEPREQHTPRRRTSSGLEALLSVSAQRRREEEMALLLGLSEQGGSQHAR
eukprot:jgi/Psemu1/300655/fgenesh1_kg.15_\